LVLKKNGINGCKVLGCDYSYRIMGEKAVYLLYLTFLIAFAPLIYWSQNKLN
jgi:hypothetical protein